MQEIIDECKEGKVHLCDHAMSLLKIVASNIWNIDFTWAKKSLHCVDDGLGNYISQTNIWHETMFQHTNICTKKNNE